MSARDTAFPPCVRSTMKTEQIRVFEGCQKNIRLHISGGKIVGIQMTLQNKGITVTTEGKNVTHRSLGYPD